MNEQSEQIVPLVKALTNADRLRVIGLLSQRPATLRQVADELHLPAREALNHLAFLEHVALVRKQPTAGGQEVFYELDTSGLEQTAKGQLASEPRELQFSAPGMDEKSRRVLRACLNADGTIRQIPIQQPDKL